MHNRKRLLVSAVAVAAAAAPSTASARFVLNDPVSGPAPSTASWQPSQAAAARAAAAPTAQSSSSEFDWGDAGIGAVAAVALMGGGTLALGSRRHRGQTARVS